MESALRAQEGGADRIELCDNPAEGGTTPSLGLIEVVRKSVSMDLFVMIRPRGGDFCYSNDEFYAMKRDIAQCQKIGVDGFVFGMLNPDGSIDRKRCAELIAKCRPLRVTCHRAFDMARDPFEALEDCIDIGFDRILTSGGKTKAIEGVELIQSLIEKAAGRIAVMPGSGVNEENAGSIVQQTGAQELHFSAMAFRESRMKFHNEQLSTMGSQTMTEYQVRTVDPPRVKKIRELATVALRNRT